MCVKWCICFDNQNSPLYAQLDGDTKIRFMFHVLGISLLKKTHSSLMESKFVFTRSFIVVNT